MRDGAIAEVSFAAVFLVDSQIQIFTLVSASSGDVLEDFARSGLLFL